MNDMRMTRPRRRAAGDPRGIVLILTVLLVGLMLVMGITMINLAASDYQIANNESRSIQALYNADAGTEEAKMRISPNAPTASAIPIGTAATWRAYVLSGRTQAEIQGGLDATYGYAAPSYATTEATTNYLFYNSIQTGSNTIPWGWARIQHKTSGGGVVYQNVLDGSETTSATQTVGALTVNNPPILLVTTEGIQGTVRRMISVEYQPIVAPTTTTTSVVTDPFGHAAHAKGGVSLNGNASTDSYNSDNGAYNVGGNRFQRGHVSSDSTAGNTINLTAGSTVNGDAYAGPGANVAASINNGGTITGVQSTESTTWSLPLSAIPTGVTNLGNLSLSGNPKGDCSYSLSEGTYWFSSVSVTGNAKLCVNGAVKIYVTGSIDVGGNGIATANNKPPNLLLYGTVNPTDATKKCTSVNIHGNGNFYGAVYAPDADISVVGNGGVYGSLTGKSVSINGNGGLHYDEALGNLGRFVTTAASTTYTTTGFRRYSWREIPF
jgi:Tfp pilus assembly protein PilX